MAQPDVELAQQCPGLDAASSASQPLISPATPRIDQTPTEPSNNRFVKFLDKLYLPTLTEMEACSTNFILPLAVGGCVIPSMFLAAIANDQSQIANQPALLSFCVSANSVSTLKVILKFSADGVIKSSEVCLALLGCERCLWDISRSLYEIPALVEPRPDNATNNRNLVHLQGSMFSYIGILPYVAMVVVSVGSYPSVGILRTLRSCIVNRRLSKLLSGNGAGESGSNPRH